MTLPYARPAVVLAALAVLLAAPPALAQAVPDITVTPASSDLGTLSVPGGTDFEIEVRNDGVGDLVITDAFATDVTGDGSFNSLYDLEDFDFDLDLPYTLAPGETQRFGLTISPFVGRQDGSVTFESNDPDEPTVVAPITYFGTEIRFGPVMPSQIDFGTVSVAVNSFGDVTEAPTVCREVRVPTEGDEGGFAERAAVDDDQFTVPALADEFDTVLLVNDTLSFDVCYTPNTVGAASATLDFDVGSLVNDFQVFSRTVSLTGEATTTNLPPVPQGIADGDVIEVETGGAAVTLAFSFLSPESGQTTTIELFDSDTLPDGFEDDGEFPGTFTFMTTPGNPATAEATFEFGDGGFDSVDRSGDYSFFVEACDDGPGRGGCTALQFVARVNPVPTVACEPGVNLRMEFLGEDFVTLYISQSSPVDPSGCSLVTFDGLTDRAVASVPLEVAPPFNDFVYAEDGFSTAPGGGDATLPAGAIPDEFGAVTVVRGAPAVGDPVSSVVGNVVSAVVYRTPSDVVGVVPESPLSPSNARRAGGAADLAALLASMGGGAEARPLAVGPNPTRGGAAVTFRLGAGADVRVAVYDVLGREVAVLAEGAYPAGAHRVALAAGALPAGPYVVRLVAGGAAQTARLTVVR